MAETKNAVVEVIREFNRVCKIHPDYNSPHEGFAILKEEVDELWDDVKRKQHDPMRKKGMREEAIQIGACALRFLMSCCGLKGNVVIFDCNGLSDKQTDDIRKEIEVMQKKYKEECK